MDSQLLESLDYLYVPAPDFEAAVWPIISSRDHCC